MTTIKLNGPYGNILIVIVAGIGDFMESISSLKNVRDSYPEAEISLLVSSKVYEYAKQCPYSDAVYSFPVSRGRGFAPGGLKSAARYLSLITELRKRRFDAAIDLYEVSTFGGALRMALLFKGSGIRNTFGRNTGGRGLFFTSALEEKDGEKFNQAHYFNGLARLFTGKDVIERALPWISPPDEKTVDELLKEWGITPAEKIMLINPGSDRPTRRWFPDNFARVIDYFSACYQLKTVLTGSAAEVAAVEEIAGLARVKIFSAAGRLSVGGLAALVRRSEILFTTNSAAMHLAGLFGTPFVAVAGSGDPFRDRPQGDEHKMSILWKKFECNPCDNWKCEKNTYMECMRLISADEVIEAGRRLLGGSGS